MSTIRFDLPANPSEVAPARHRVLRQLRAWESQLDEETTEDVGLVVSELLTNAVVHSGGSRVGVTLRVAGRRGRRRLCVAVSDQGCPEPGPQLPAPPDQESGRGLTLVEALSARCGATPTEHGKDCWAELAIPDALARTRGDATTALATVRVSDPGTAPLAVADNGDHGDADSS